MRALKRLLWPVDISKGYTLSLIRIFSNYKQYGSEIILLYVLDISPERDSIREDREIAAMSELNRIANLLKHLGRYKVEIRLEYGTLQEKILELAVLEKVNSIFFNDIRKIEIGVDSPELLSG